MQKAIFVSFCSAVFFLTTLTAQPQDISSEKKFSHTGKRPLEFNYTLLKSRHLNFEKKKFAPSFDKEKKKVYVKFKRTPNKGILAKLTREGIVLSRYLSDNVYLVETDQNKLNRLKKMSFIEGFASLDVADKMSERLYFQEIPSYARNNDYVKINVRFDESTTYRDAVYQIMSFGGKIHSEKFSRTHKLLISLPSNKLLEFAELELVIYMEEILPPASVNNIDAGALSNVFDNDSGYITGLFSAPYSLKGFGVNVAVKDEGQIYSHVDFTGRLTIAEMEDISIHSTHVAGTIGAALSINDNDTYGNTGGMAELVNLISFNFQGEGDYTADFVTAITSYSAPIVNNSWGIKDIGWFWDYHNNRWADAGNSDLFGAYTSDTQDFDDFMYDYYDNDALLVKSAGNERDDPPNVAIHDGDYDCIPPISCAKNVFTVGSIGVDGDDYISSEFSSWGATNDGRVKPDFVADGYQLKSTVNLYNYAFSDGTSMSCPVVTGICALIHEAYESMHGVYPSADIVKALLCNYAIDLPLNSPDGPDFSFGFGLVDAKASIEAVFNIDASSGGHIVQSTVDETGDYIEYQFEVIEGINDTRPIKITLCWIDPPGDTSVVDVLVNDLDVTVIRPDDNPITPYYFREYNDVTGFAEFDPSNPGSAKKGGAMNRCDTVEQIEIENDGEIIPGLYRIRVSGYKVPMLNQLFALVSSIGFNGFNFNYLRVKNPEGMWISNIYTVLNQNPDVLLMVTELDNEGYNPYSFEYSWSSDNGGTWSNWASVDGVYTDTTFSTTCSNPHYGKAYVKVNQVPFTKVSSYENRIKFRLTYNSETQVSPIYSVRNNNTYYVSTEDGDDTTGKGTEINPWQTIGHAITNSVATAQVPAIINVQVGEYEENICLNDYVYLYGGFDDNWNRNISNIKTIDIDSSVASVITAISTNSVVIADNNVIIDGFVIQGGNTIRGGGVYSNYDNVEISNCLIRNNFAQYGGGIFVSTSNSTLISNCLLYNNTARTPDGVIDFSCGGGLCVSSATVTMRNTDLVNNKGTVTSMGGGVYCENSPLTVEQCRFENNSAQAINNGRAWGGAYFVFENYGQVIKNSVFCGNYCTGSTFSKRGGAIFIAGALDVNEDTVIVGSLFDSNKALEGSVIYCNNEYAINLTFANCTFWGNGETANQQTAVIDPCNVSSSINTISNCIFWNNFGKDFIGDISDITYSCVDNDSYNGTGTIHDNPQFRDASNGDFHLNIESPCIDAGNDNATGLDLLTTDIDGNPRILEFDNSGSNSVDMGADEYAFRVYSIESDNDEINLEWYSVPSDTYHILYSDDSAYGTASPVLHYSLNDNDNDSVVTESISSINATLKNQQGSINTENYSATGKLNTTFTFSGQEYINCGNTGNFTSDLSLAAWVYKDSTATNHMNIVAKDWNNSYRIRVNSDGKVWVYLNNTQPSYTSTSSLIASDTWVHLVVTISFATGDQNIRIYVDGDLEETIAHTKTSINSTSGNLIIGAFGAGSTSESWKGCLDDIRLYDIVLSQTDVDSLYYGGIGTEERNPLPWTRVAQSITGQQGSTSWTDDGTETSPAPNDSSVDHRFYRVVFDN
ncbi:MAG: S8 family serine peptidase [Candidatus Auribacterota bacterium]